MVILLDTCSTFNVIAVGVLAYRIVTSQEWYRLRISLVLECTVKSRKKIAGFNGSHAALPWPEFVKPSAAYSNIEYVVTTKKT